MKSFPFHGLPVVIAACALMTIAPSAKAQSCYSAEMQSVPARAGVFAAVQIGLLSHINQIERIPPDQAAYIAAERDAALTTSNKERWRLVRQNNFFFAQQVRVHYKVIEDNLIAAQRAKSVADQAVYASVTLSRFADLSDALREYIEFDKLRSNPIYARPGSGFEDVWFDIAMAKSRTLEALQCSIRQMREP